VVKGKASGIRELKKVIFSITFLILIVGMFAMAYSQDVIDMSDREKLEMPQIGQDYGLQAKEVPEVIMNAALESLYNEFCSNNYALVRYMSLKVQIEEA